MGLWCGKMGAMDSAPPNYVSHEPVGSLGEFFERIEREDGPILTAEDHRLIVETIMLTCGLPSAFVVWR